MDIKKIFQIHIAIVIVFLAVLNSLFLIHQLLILILIRPEWFREFFNQLVCTVVVYLTVMEIVQIVNFLLNAFISRYVLFYAVLVGIHCELRSIDVTKVDELSNVRLSGSEIIAHYS